MLRGVPVENAAGSGHFDNIWGFLERVHARQEIVPLLQEVPDIDPITHMCPSEFWTMATKLSVVKVRVCTRIYRRTGEYIHTFDISLMDQDVEAQAQDTGISIPCRRIPVFRAGDELWMSLYKISESRVMLWTNSEIRLYELHSRN